MRPLLRYVGGKSRLAPLLADVWRSRRYRRLIEPFAGSAALFFELQPKHAVLVDACEPLMLFYKWLRKRPVAFVREWRKLISMQPGEANYYTLRHNFNFTLRNKFSFTTPKKSGDPRASEEDVGVHLAAWFLYLNCMCFQGLWRVNNAGEMNVPFGGYTAKRFRSIVDIRAAVSVLRRPGVLIKCADFRFALDGVGVGDFVYADPPYVGAYDSYTPGGFSLYDHERLAELGSLVRASGATMLVSNSDTIETRKIYTKKWWDYFEVPQVQSIAPYNNRKGRVPEVLLLAK